MMKQVSIFLTLLYFLCFFANAQDSARFKIHSHNDYLQKAPFWEAYAAGASSIEVDVILQDGQLMAAHEIESINPSKTLQSLYLDPIRNGIKNELIEGINFTLLVDLKTSALPTLEVLQEIMQSYADLAYSDENPDGLKLIISGNRPEVKDYVAYPEWMFFDFQSKDLNSDLPWSKIGMVSLSFRQFSIWNGKGRMVEEQRIGLQDFIDKVHSFEKPVRFWGTPDTKTAWKVFYEMGVDYINTDKPFEAEMYLNNLSAKIYQNPNTHKIYQPNYQLDGADLPVKKIILMIGDGNGLAQISAALFANGNELNITKLKKIGLIKTQAADDFTTDSAAGATAYATGEKTNNRAIGVDPDGKRIENLPDILNEFGFKSGVISTDDLTGATPASFYAHHPERGDSEEIASYLAESKLDLFIGGGREAFDSQLVLLENSGVEFLDDFLNTDSERVGFFAEAGSLPSAFEGRGDFLAKSTEYGLAFLGKNESDFFLMVEAAMIDWGGHENNTRKVISEMLDFDQVIGDVIKYADKHPGTLVLVTADHETGGISIPQGNIENSTLELAYHSDDHTGIMVPIFAYGAHSDEFQGVYENIEVFHKLMKLVNQYHSK